MYFSAILLMFIRSAAIQFIEIRMKESALILSPTCNELLKVDLIMFKNVSFKSKKLLFIFPIPLHSFVIVITFPVEE